MYIDGFCDTDNVCKCIKQTAQSEKCVYDLKFENSQQILVVKENVGFASVTIKIEPSDPLCIWQKNVTFKVSCISYTATYDEDYQGSNCKFCLKYLSFCVWNIFILLIFFQIF